MILLTACLCLSAGACPLAWGGDVSANVSSAGESVSVRVDWPSYLGARDMVWKKAPTAWDNAPFLGNGLVGMQVMRDSKNKKMLKLCLGRMDAQEHMEIDDGKDGKKTGDWTYHRYRVPIGYFSFEMPDEIKHWDLRLRLWDAELTGTVGTDGGKYAIRAYVHATAPVLVMEMTPEQGAPVPVWNWNPFGADSPRMNSWSKNLWKKEAPDLELARKGEAVSLAGGIKGWRQPLRPSGEVGTAWKFVSGAKGKQTLYISIDHSFPGNTATAEASSCVGKAVAAPAGVLEQLHRDWWHKFYPEAFLSIPDSYWDSFYWAQMYKIGSGMRANGPVLDLQGPWTALEVNSWPGVWWNLNVQLTYWSCYTGNRLEAAKSLSNTLKKYRTNLINNVDEQYRSDSAGIPRASGPDASQPTGKPNGGPGSKSEVGSLAWTCHNLFTQYRMSMDDAFLKDDVYPLLRRAVNYYIHFLEQGEDGKLHLPPTLSPEYGIAPDCNYDLSLLRWGCQTLIWTTDRLKIKDPLLPKWKEILANLTDYPQNENGYMIGKGVPFKHSHRHYSHLFMAYPLHIVDTDDPEMAKLVDKSVRHWHSLKGGLQGYSFSGGASLYATLGWGNDAYEMLNGLKRFIRPNTLYKETFPVIETPMSGAASIHDMLLQSWNGLINVFPAVPDAWGDVAVHHLRAEGSFLVSAVRKDGKTQWVRVVSLAGEPLRLRVHMDAAAVLSGSGSASLKKNAKGDWVGIPAKGTEVLLTLPGVKPMVAPVATPEVPKNFGMK